MINIRILATGETPKARDNARGHLFEVMVGGILTRLGHHIDELNSHQSGGEIDMTCRSLIGRVPCVIECKAHQRPVSVGDLKKFRSTYEDFRRLDQAAIGIMVSLGGFGPDAYEYYRQQIESHYPHFELWDAAHIYELLVAGGLTATYQEVKSLVEVRTGLGCDQPQLIYAHSQYFWLVRARAASEQLFTRFIVTDSKGMLLRDPAVLGDLAALVTEEVDPAIICSNDAFPEPYHRAVLTEAGRYFGVRGRYQFPARTTLRAVLGKKRPALSAALGDLLAGFEGALGGLADSVLWRIHGEETERILDLMIPDEVKEDLFPTELALLVAAARLHCGADLKLLGGRADGLPPKAGDAPPGAAKELWKHLRAVLSRLHEPFTRGGRPPLEGFDRVDLDFITACVKLVCGLDLAFFRAPASVYGVIEPQNIVSADTFLSFQSNGLNVDYNEHRISVDVTSYTPEAHLVVLRLADWAQSLLDDIEPILYERGIRFLRANANVTMQNYEMVGCRFEVHTESIVKLLMGRALYGTEDVAVRELVQNALDAVLTQSIASGSGYRPSVSVRLASRGGARYLEVEDNGCGMDRYIVQRYLSAIGKSFWRSEDFSALTGAQANRPESTAIGQFGIGILSAFMIGDQIEIDTKMEGAPGVFIGIPGVRDYFVVQSSERQERGTLLRLRLTKGVDVAKLLDRYMLRPKWPITLSGDDVQPLTFASTPERLWKRLKAPEDCSGRGQFYCITTPVSGDGFEGEMLVILPGDKADPRAWGWAKGGFALMQSGVLVKDSTGGADEEKSKGASPYPAANHLGGAQGHRPRVRVGIEPGWSHNCAGYLDCLPGILELTVSRNDLVEGKVPDALLKAIDSARLKALEGLKARCDHLWSTEEPPSERTRLLINLSINQFVHHRFATVEEWKLLFRTRYSLTVYRVLSDGGEQMLATAEEIKRWASADGVSVYHISTYDLSHWKDVLTEAASGDAVYIVHSSYRLTPVDTVGLAIDYLNAKDAGGASITRYIDIAEEEQGQLSRYVPGYCGFCQFNRPTFRGLVLRWSADNNWCVKRSEAADVSRFDFVRQARARGKNVKLPQIMFNTSHPAVRLLQRLADAGGEEVAPQTRRILEIVIRHVEAQSQRQKAALFNELSSEFAALLGRADALRLTTPEDRNIKIAPGELARR